MTIEPRLERSASYPSRVKSEQPKRESPVAHVNATEFELSFEDAKAMEEEIQDIYRRYREKSKEGLQRYFCLFGISPSYDSQ